ncbi:MAG: GNAT family protein [Actinomyces sp.]|uniref:GNAT family N-acetyltransferase n=1 Tax=Actinomyces sp. TaxID=29317 RepID=UPI0026DC7D00|nr:GNAT family protein [Actinomyces sp.]MDO4244301.1 GNAT family protein [Actinomyces sp.]
MPLPRVLPAPWGAGGRFAWPLRLEERRVAARGLARGAQWVVVRSVRRSDADPWRRLRLAEDTRLAPWEATLPPGSPEGLRSFGSYVRHQGRAARRGESMALVIEVDGALAGQVAVAPISWGALCSASLGYWLGSDWEGRGVMSLAVAMVLDHLLGPEVGLHRVEINVRPENARSLALCRRLGLREEGLRRSYMHVDGAWADHVSFAVVAEEMASTSGFVTRLGLMRRM